MVNDGIGNGNFTTLKPFAFWTQHVLPLVYGDEISYMETLGKMRDILNELIKNNNNLPTYIQQMIEEYISSGAIEEVIDKILSNLILNVKYPPTGIPKAKGDGTANDHDSIQGCIDYAAGLGGGVVYLPAGKYLTSSLVLKPGVTLLGFGRYATSLILAGGATTHLITGTVNDAGVVNLTLNAKMSSQVNRVDAVELVGHHIDIRNVVAKDCYTSINIQKNGTAITISNVLCETASDACLRVGGTDGGLLVDGLEMTGLSTNLGVAYIVTDSNGDIYRNINIHGTGALGINVAGSQNYFDGKISGVTKDYEDLSGDNTFELFGKSSVKNYTNDVVENANAFSQVAANGIERQGANISDNASNVYTINATNISDNASNVYTINATNISDNASNEYTINVTNSHTINAKDIVLNPAEPLTYKTPTKLNDYFNYVEFKDNNSNYKILIEGEKEIPKETFVSIKSFGAIGDGLTDDTNAINTAINSGKNIYLDDGIYLVNNTITGTNIKIIGNGTIKSNSPFNIILDLKPDKFVYINGITFDANGKSGVCLNINTSGGYANITNCVFENTNNENVVNGNSCYGCGIWGTCNTAIIHSCYASNIGRTKSKPRSWASVGIFTHIDGVAFVYNNTIDNVWCSAEKTDCDGIQIFGSALENGTVFCCNNKVTRCTGRFIKSQALNNTISNNTLINETGFNTNQYFIGIDSQYGNLYCTNNIIDLADTAESSFCCRYTSAIESSNVICNNIFKSTAQNACVSLQLTSSSNNDIGCNISIGNFFTFVRLVSIAENIKTSININKNNIQANNIFRSQVALPTTLLEITDNICATTGTIFHSNVTLINNAIIKNNYGYSSNSVPSCDYNQINTCDCIFTEIQNCPAQLKASNSYLNKISANPPKIIGESNENTLVIL